MTSNTANPPATTAGLNLFNNGQLHKSWFENRSGVQVTIYKSNNQMVVVMKDFFGCFNLVYKLKLILISSKIFAFKLILTLA